MEEGCSFRPAKQKNRVTGMRVGPREECDREGMSETSGRPKHFGVDKSLSPPPVFKACLIWASQLPSLSSVGILRPALQSWEVSQPRTECVQMEPGAGGSPSPPFSPALPLVPVGGLRVLTPFPIMVFHLPHPQPLVACLGRPAQASFPLLLTCSFCPSATVGEPQRLVSGL